MDCIAFIRHLLIQSALKIKHFECDEYFVLAFLFFFIPFALMRAIHSDFFRNEAATSMWKIDVSMAPLIATKLDK